MQRSRSRRPVPQWIEGRWRLDLRRPFRLGQHILPPEISQADVAEAVHRSWELFLELRDRAAGRSAQVALPLDGAPASFGSLVDRWQAQRAPGTTGGAQYLRAYARVLRAELGDTLLSELDGAAGRLVIQVAVNRWRAAGLAARTIRNRAGMVTAILRFAHSLGWLSAVPAAVELPVLPGPRVTWINEATMRALAALICADDSPSMRSFLPDAGERAAYARARRLYLGWMFYTGSHKADTDNLTSDRVSLDVGLWLRVNSKAGRACSPEWFELPEGLADLLRADVAARGRPWYSGEKIAGGGWHNFWKRVDKARRKMGIPHSVNALVLRHSTVAHLALAGEDEDYCRRYLGHVDASMVRAIYESVRPRLGVRRRSRWTRDKIPAGAPGGAQVIEFKKGGKK